MKAIDWTALKIDWQGYEIKVHKFKGRWYTLFYQNGFKVGEVERLDPPRSKSHVKQMLLNFLDN